LPSSRGALAPFSGLRGGKGLSAWWWPCAASLRGRSTLPSIGGRAANTLEVAGERLIGPGLSEREVGLALLAAAIVSPATSRVFAARRMASVVVSSVMVVSMSNEGRAGAT
jgi:hypothetical protein